MKILIFAEEYPPHGSGVASSARRIGQGFGSSGHDVVVLTYDRLPFEGLDARAEICQDGVARVLKVGPYMRFPKRTKTPKFDDSTKAILRRRFIETVQWELNKIDFEPDLIISLYLTDAGYLSCFLANHFRCPHIAGVRGNDLGLNLFDPTKVSLSSFVLDRADAVAYVNSFLYKMGTAAFPTTADISYVTANSITSIPETPRHARDNLLKHIDCKASDVIFAYVGLFREKKGCVEIVDAFEKLHKEDPYSKAKLLLISPELSKLEEMAIGDRLRSLITAGHAIQISDIPREQVIEHISGADFILMPSRNDGMANALLEGMACGLCPIVSEIFPELVTHGENGIVLEAVSGPKLLEAIKYGIENVDTCREMGKAARAKVQARSPQDEAADYLAIYSQLTQAIDFGSRVVPTVYASDLMAAAE